VTSIEAWLRDHPAPKRLSITVRGGEGGPYRGAPLRVHVARRASGLPSNTSMVVGGIGFGVFFVSSIPGVALMLAAVALERWMVQAGSITIEDGAMTASFTRYRTMVRLESIQAIDTDTDRESPDQTFVRARTSVGLVPLWLDAPERAEWLAAMLRVVVTEAMGRPTGIADR
jgi:hypothetical protein